MSAPLPPDSSEHEPWSPSVRRSLPQRMLRGWGLVGTIACLIVIYFMVRGLKEYRSFKAYLSHSEVTKALQLSKDGNEQGAIALLEKAGARSPNDPIVLRALADFNEPRQDPMTLYALRKLVNNRDANAEDRERLCRLAFDWGHPELADSETLREWALSDIANLELRPLELSARWMASRGQGAAAETRLRKALDQATGDAAKPAIEIVLTRLLLSSGPAQAGKKEVISECLSHLESALRSTSPPSPLHGEAAKIITSMALKPEWTALIPDASIALARHELLAQAEALTKNPLGAQEMRLQEAATHMLVKPEDKESLAKELVEKGKSASLPERAALARWLIDHELSASALEICDTNPNSLTQREWFTLRLDALHALKRWDTVKELLTASSQPLPNIVQALFLLTVDKSSGADEAAIDGRRKHLKTEVSRAEFKEVLYVAGVLERTREIGLAMDLFDSLQNHSQAGLPARLGLVRCLSLQLDRTSELMNALGSLLVLWPNSDEARSDLAYLRLLDRTQRQEDVQAAITLTRNNPWYLAYRIPAALALLRINEKSEALGYLASVDVPWAQARPGWIAVYASVLAANGKTEEAQKWAGQLKANTLRPGERKLLEEFQLKPLP